MDEEFRARALAAGWTVPPRPRSSRRIGHDDRQTSLPLDEAPPLDRHDLLLAALLEAPLRSTCADHGWAARRDGVFHGRLVSGHRLHVTLFFAGFLGSLPPQAVPCLAQTMDGCLPFEPIPLVLDALISRGDRLLLGSTADDTEARRFARRLRRALGEAGWPWPMHHRFSPHITLGHGPCLAGSRPVAPIEAVVLRMRMLHGRHGEGMHRHPIGGPDGPDVVLAATACPRGTRGATLPSFAALPLG